VFLRELGGAVSHSSLGGSVRTEGEVYTGMKERAVVGTEHSSVGCL